MYHEPPSDALQQHDPRLRALDTALARARGAGDAALPPATAQRLQASLHAHLQGHGGRAPAALSHLETLEVACLQALLDAGLLDRACLAAVHAAFAEMRDEQARSTPGVNVQQALAARDRQLSIATHELRTPISSILLNLQMLERTARSKGALDAATVARLLAVPSRQLRRLTRMVDLLLDSAQVENERLELDLQPVDLCELVHDAAARLADTARAAGCELSLGDCHPATGRWDRLRLEQVVVNLLTNAIKYGGGQVEVGTQGGSEALLTVRDHGQGIGPEDQQRIFEPYERLASAAGEDGAGLGLYIVREVVRAHGGRIEVESAPGQGATFRVFLPI